MQLKGFLKVTGLVVFCWSGVASADLSDETDALCKKVKECGLQQMEKEGGAPEVRQMMEAMFDNMCVTMTQPYTEAATKAGLESEAKACVNSFINQSCDVLMQSKGGQTEECIEFEKAAEAAGIKLK